jgi:hypothetical protein
MKAAAACLSEGDNEVCKRYECFFMGVFKVVAT